MGVLFGRRETRSWIGEPPIPPYPGADMYGRSAPTTPNQALAVPAVWQCVGLLANSVSLMPLRAYRNTPSGVPASLPDLPVLTSPSEGMTQSEWLHSLMVSLLLRGNAYARISRKDAYERPQQLDLLNPDTVTPNVEDDGSLSYRVNGVTAPEGSVWHVRGLTLPGAKVGLSPISYAAAVLGVDLSSRKFAGDYFDNGGVPKAVLSSDQLIDQAGARTLKERFLNATRNREPMVLGQGATYQQIQVAPNESQFLETQQASVAQIARYFWIPPKMVGGSDGNSMTYANVEQLSLDFLTFAVGFWLKRIEDAIFPLLPKPQFVKFDTSGLLRTDTETQARVDLMLLAGKVKAPSEIRQERSLPPMTDDQKQEADLVPLTQTPNGGVKGLPALKEPPGPVAPVPADDQQGADVNA